MVQDILDTILAWVTGFWGFVSETINAAIGIFYGGDPAALTPIGILALFGVAIGIVYLGLNFVRGFFQK